MKGTNFTISPLHQPVHFLHVILSIDRVTIHRVEESWDSISTLAWSRNTITVGWRSRPIPRVGEMCTTAKHPKGGPLQGNLTSSRRTTAAFTTPALRAARSPHGSLTACGAGDGASFWGFGSRSAHWPGAGAAGKASTASWRVSDVTQNVVP